MLGGDNQMDPGLATTLSQADEGLGGGGGRGGQEIGELINEDDDERSGRIRGRCDVVTVA